MKVRFGGEMTAWGCTMKQYLYAKPGTGAQGPFDEAHLRRLLAEAAIGPDTLVTEAGTEAWRPLAQVIDLPTTAASGQAGNPPPPATPAPKLALFSNGAALLLSLAIVVAAYLIAYRPGAQDPVSHFKRAAEEKRKKLEQELSTEGSTMADFTFDITRTDSEITPYEAEMSFRYDDTVGGDHEVVALFRWRDGAWRTDSIFVSQLAQGTPQPGGKHVVFERRDRHLGRDKDTKVEHFSVNQKEALRKAAQQVHEAGNDNDSYKAAANRYFGSYPHRNIFQAINRKVVEMYGRDLKRTF
jgi:hypothetical protein